LGLNVEKFKLYPDLSKSIIITANEQNDYFKVLLKAFSLIKKEIAEKTTHIGHGMMRLTTGKMGSRKGNVITAENFIADVKELVEEKIKDRQFDKVEKEKLSEMVAIAAIKYQILRQSIGGDIIYDPEKSVSFEGDSGPYLQYSTVRAQTVLTKAKEVGIAEKIKEIPKETSLLEKLLLRFPEVVERGVEECAPHHVTTYLTELAAAFNAYYANNLIIDLKNPLSPYRVALTKSFVAVMKNGLWLLGIKVPERM
jgi:arginyl-tRNA synthetase